MFSIVVSITEPPPPIVVVAVDVSVAVATPSGLMVPVIRNVESKGFASVEKVFILKLGFDWFGYERKRRKNHNGRDGWWNFHYQ